MYNYWIVDKSFLLKNNPFIFSPITSVNRKKMASHDGLDYFFQIVQHVSKWFAWLQNAHNS